MRNVMGVPTGLKSLPIDQRGAVFASVFLVAVELIGFSQLRTRLLPVQSHVKARVTALKRGV
jgi:hypothetical protein